MKIEALDALPREMMGDGGRPNLFLVSTRARGVVLISREFQVAYDYWCELATSAEPVLESRNIGTIACVEPRNEDGSGGLVRIDDSHMFRRELRSRANY